MILPNPILLLALCGDPTTDVGPTTLQSEIDALRSEIATWRHERIAARTEEERRVVSRSIAEARLATVLDDIRIEDRTFRPRWNEIGSADGRFTLLMNCYEQFDWVLNKTEGRPSERGFAIFNTRLTFSGQVYGPEWTYVVRLSFGENLTGDNEFAFLQRDLGDGWTCRAGLITPYFSLEQAIDTTETLGTSLSYVAGQFDPQNTEGAALAWEGTSWRGWVQACNGWAANNRSWNGNARLAVIARGEWKPFGDWTDLYCFNPYPDHVVPGMLLGIGASYGAGTSRPPMGDPLDGPATRLTTDISWQHPGLGFAGSFSWQDAEAGGDLAGRRMAATAQASIMPTPHWSLYARGEWGSVPGGDQPDLAGVTLGASWFPTGDATLKWTLECLGMFGDTVGWRRDGDPAILQVDADQFAVRSQVQISF